MAGVTVPRSEVRIMALTCLLPAKPGPRRAGGLTEAGPGLPVVHHGLSTLSLVA